MELLDQLLFLNSIVENAEDDNGRSNDIALFRDPLLKLASYLIRIILTLLQMIC